MFKNILIGFLTGIVSGLFGSGGGMLLLPFLTLVSKEDEISSRATTIFCIFFMVITSSFLYYFNSLIDWSIALKCSIGGVCGGYFGSKLLLNLNKNILKILLIFFLFYTGVKMIL